MVNAKSLIAPMISGVQLTQRNGDLFPNPQLYQNIVGKLQYVTITRLDLAFSINKFYQFIHALRDTHWKDVKKILRYTQRTSHLGMLLTKSRMLPLVGFVDAN